MGNNDYKRYNVPGQVKIEIALEKVCYLPGESIKGSIILTPNFNVFCTKWQWYRIQIW